MKTRAVLLAFVSIGVLAINLVLSRANPQFTSLRSATSRLQSTKQEVNALQWRLMELNIERAYRTPEDYSEGPVEYNQNRQRFTTQYFVPSGSRLLAATSGEQLRAFDGAINGLCLGLIGRLDLPLTSFKEARDSIEADFVTAESSVFVVIARFRDGKMQLIREKLGP